MALTSLMLMLLQISSAPSMAIFHHKKWKLISTCLENLVNSLYYLLIEIEGSDLATIEATVGAQLAAVGCYAYSNSMGFATFTLRFISGKQQNYTLMFESEGTKSLPSREIYLTNPITSIIILNDVPHIIVRSLISKVGNRRR